MPALEGRQQVTALSEQLENGFNCEERIRPWQGTTSTQCSVPQCLAQPIRVGFWVQKVANVSPLAVLLGVAQVFGVTTRVPIYLRRFVPAMERIHTRAVKQSKRCVESHIRIANCFQTKHIH